MQMVGTVQVVNVGRKKESVRRNKDKSEASILEDYRNSSINKKTL